MHPSRARRVPTRLVPQELLPSSPPRTGPQRAAHYAGHAALGYDFLALLVLRLLWRWMNAVPALPGDLKPWERYAANIGHLGLYLLMFAASLGGCGHGFPMQEYTGGLQV